MAVDDRAAALSEATKNLTRVTTELQKFNESTGVEIAKIVGKDLKKISDPFVQSFANIPGVQTLGSIGGTLFNKAFAKMKEKREMKHLADQLGLDKLEFEQFKKQNEVLKSEEKAAAELKSAAESILGFSVQLPENFKQSLGEYNKAAGGFVMETEKLKELQSKEEELAKKRAEIASSDNPDTEELKNVIKEQREVKKAIEEGTQAKPVVALLNKQKDFLETVKDNGVEMNRIGLNTNLQGIQVAEALNGIDNRFLEERKISGKGKSRESEIQNEMQRREDRRDTVFGSIANGIEGMKDSIINGLAGLKDKGLMGLGVLAGLVAAPFIAISSFFTQLSAEVKVLNALTKGGLGRFFAPITNFFARIGKVLKPITDIFKRVGQVFQPLMKAAKGSASFMSGFAPIAKFAATIGRTLGKIFLPITILMSIFDFVTGFMDGYKEGGLIGGIKEGIISVVDGLVGGLIRMVTGAFAWILEAIGLDNFAASLTENVNDAIEGVYEIFRGVIDVITFPFRLIFEMIKGIFGGETDFGGLFGGLGDSIMGIFDGLINIITAPFDMIYSLVQDIFSFFDIELPDFDLAETITGFISAAYDFVKDKVKGFFSFLGFGGDEKEEELEKAKAEERRLSEAGAVSADGFQASTVKINGFTDVARSEASIRASGLEVATPEQRAALEEAAAARTAAAEQALQDFINAPKLSDAIGAVKEKMGEVFSGISTAVTNGFTAAKDWVVGLFTFSDEDASVAGIATKLIDIVLAPYNLAINFLKGIFGFGEDEQGNIAPFSLGELIVGVVTDIIDFFKGLFDIDIMGLVKSIPGAGKILSFFGFGDESPTAPTGNTVDYEDKIMDAELERERIQAKIDKGNFGSVGVSDRDEKRRVAELEEQIAELQRLQTEQQQVQVINNNNVVNANTSNNASTTTIAPMRDTSPPSGTVPAYG